MQSVRKTEHQQRIESFMTKAEQELPQSPCIPSEEVRRLRAQLILEEALETIDALGFTCQVSALRIASDNPPNLIAIADGCADLSVVTIGTLSACGIADEALLEEIDRSNLDKFRGDAHKDENGKWRKPSDWKPPEIERVLAEQTKAVKGVKRVEDGILGLTLGNQPRGLTIEEALDISLINRPKPAKRLKASELAERIAKQVFPDNYEQNGHGWAEPKQVESRSNQYASIEEYRAAMKAAGRFVNDSYNRICSDCHRVPIHKLNTGGICADCISDQAVKELKNGA